MRKITIVFLGLLFFIDLAVSQIYYKKIVYVFDYKIEKENEPAKVGLLYLGCLGKPWPFKQRQAAVIWTTDKRCLREKNLISTGIIEEDHYIWLHPPRDDEFSILEYSPFPAIRFPVSQNKNWKWKLTPNKYWVNKEYDIKEDDVLMYDFNNTGLVNHTLKYQNSTIECWKIDAESTDLKNSRSFSGLFNSEYGFVKMTFTNIDKSIITLELIRTQDWKYFRKEKSKTDLNGTNASDFIHLWEGVK